MRLLLDNWIFIWGEGGGDTVMRFGVYIQQTPQYLGHPRPRSRHFSIRFLAFSTLKGQWFFKYFFVLQYQYVSASDFIDRSSRLPVTHRLELVHWVKWLFYILVEVVGFVAIFSRHILLRNLMLYLRKQDYCPVQRLFTHYFVLVS